MRTYTAHLRPGRPPVLVREGWSWGACLFGPIWLLAHRAWLAAALQFALGIAIGVLARGPAWVVLELALAALTGLLGRDLVRWSLARRGYTLAHVLAARDSEGALGRLLALRTDLAPLFLDRPGAPVFRSLA